LTVNSRLALQRLEELMNIRDRKTKEDATFYERTLMTTLTDIEYLIDRLWKAMQPHIKKDLPGEHAP
jgi:molecular chaperone GrpE (heat shock protein)